VLLTSFWMRQFSKQVLRIAKIVARKFMDNAKLVAVTAGRSN
jgi:hypothetical protein